MHVEYSSVLNFRGGGFSKEGVGSQHNFLEVRVGGGGQNKATFGARYNFIGKNGWVGRWELGGAFKL